MTLTQFGLKSSRIRNVVKIKFNKRNRQENAPKKRYTPHTCCTRFFVVVLSGVNPELDQTKNHICTSVMPRSPKSSRQYEFCMRFWLDSCCMLPNVRNARATFVAAIGGRQWDETGRVMLSAVTFSCVCVSRCATATGFTFINTPFWPYIERKRKYDEMLVCSRDFFQNSRTTRISHIFRCVYLHTHTTNLTKRELK